MKNKEIIIFAIILISMILVLKNISALESGIGVGLNLKINQTASTNNNTNQNNSDIEDTNDEEYYEVNDEDYENNYDDEETTTGSRTDETGTFRLGNTVKSINNTKANINPNNNTNNLNEEKLIKNQTVQQGRVSITVNKQPTPARSGITGLIIFDNSNMKNEIKYGGIFLVIFLAIILVTLVIIEKKH